MANEARVNMTLTIRKTSGSIIQIDWRSSPGAYTADVAGTKGPTPGALTIPVGGEAVSFDELDTPGLCFLMNNDDENYVTYGIWDIANDLFHPLGELLPGEFQIIRLSRILQQEFTGTGTGTTGPDNRFFMKADTAPVNVTVAAFEA